MTRRVVTATTINELAGRGGTDLLLGPADIVTLLAVERAADLGVRLIRPGEETVPTEPPKPAELVKPVPQATGDEPPARDLVRRAVVGVLGEEPAGLETAIDKVIGGGRS